MRRLLRLLALFGAVSCSSPASVAETLPASAAPAPMALRFAEFYQSPVGPQGLVMSEKLKTAAGREVQLRGWMVAQETPPHGYFLLTARPVRLSEHADGEADDLPAATVLVRLPTGGAGSAPASASTASWPHQAGLIEMAGTLRVGRSVEPDGRVSWIQLQLH
jgi:hypothetical protein